jgi:hypothetical protein
MFSSSAFSQTAFSATTGNNAIAVVSGVAALGAIGTVTVSNTEFIYPEGVVAYGEIGYVNIWQLIPTVQSANWTAVPT